MGSVKTVMKVWKECYNAYVAAIVTNEDSTPRDQSMAEQVAAGTMTEAERRYKPKMPGNLGFKKADHGELPLEQQEIDKLSDPIRFVKNYKRE
jgi:hypothetical protein